MLRRCVCFAPPEEGQEQLGVRLLSNMRIVLGDEEQMATEGIDKLHKLNESPRADIKEKPLMTAN
jgi:hypothetical protein